MPDGSLGSHLLLLGTGVHAVAHIAHHWDHDTVHPSHQHKVQGTHAVQQKPVHPPKQQPKHSECLIRQTGEEPIKAEPEIEPEAIIPPEVITANINKAISTATKRQPKRKPKTPPQAPATPPQPPKEPEAVRTPAPVKTPEKKPERTLEDRRQAHIRITMGANEALMSMLEDTIARYNET